MDGLPLISIVLPAYNAEKTIGQCVESILSQSFKDFELIIVDDGSTDQTYNLCIEYHDERIAVFHNDNQGVSATRNFGIEKARGKYIIFVDADDALPIESLSIRVSDIEGYDLIVCSYSMNNAVIENGYCEGVSSKEALYRIALTTWIRYEGYIWNKMFNLEIIKNNKISFREDIYYNEDRLFCVEYLKHCTKVLFNDKVVYLYNDDSIGAMQRIKKVTDEDKEKILSEFKTYDMMIELVGNDDELKKKIKLNEFFRARNIYRSVPKTCLSIRAGILGIINKTGYECFVKSLKSMKFLQACKILIQIIIKR